MRTITFGYNSSYIISTTIIISIAIIMLLSTACFLNDPGQWLIFIPASIIVFAIARFFALNYFLPMLKRKPALLLDEEKIVSFVSDTMLYWKEIAKVDKYGTLTYTYFLFELKNGELIRINTKWVEGSGSIIYSNIQQFYTAAIKNS